MSEQKSDLGFDPDALRERYRSERDKRIRDDASDQYFEASGEYAHFAEHDPYVEPIERDPIVRDIDAVVIGAGFSGMMAAARLKERGVSDVTVIESGGDFGGTWYWNRYPGAQCDIESYCYLPLLEEVGYMPKEKYSYAPEIYEHSQRVAKYFGLYDNALFQTRVTEVRWVEEDERWLVSTHRGDQLKARFVIQATGPANRPKLPGIEGIEDFEGHSFHTCRWDYEYTGGDHNGELTKLGDKRVAIIGTGATAIQCVPYLGKHAEQLYVFQRTPSSVDFRGNSPTDPQWAQSLESGWQRKRRENFAAILFGFAGDAEDLVNDGWTALARRIGIALRSNPGQGLGDPAEMARKAELADFEQMNEIRARCDDEVQDPETAEALKPYYRQFCKRPTFNDEYLPTFNRPNVELVDVSASKGVDRITKKGVVANGKEYEVDCIIYGTGFEITTAAHRRVDYQTIGRDGKTLFEHWENGYRTLHGLASHGFPNWFTIGINQNGLSPNMTSMFDDQAMHVAFIIDHVLSEGKTVAEVTPEAEEKWVQQIINLSTAMGAPEFQLECTPGYYNNEGRPELANPQNAPYGLGINAFNALLATWREEGKFEGLDIK